MNTDLIWIAVLAGAATWAFRALPTILMTSEARAGGLLSKFLASTGPAAIATLFVASILPEIYPAPRDILPLIGGVAAVVLAFLPNRSVVLATLAGAIAYGVIFALTT